MLLTFLLYTILFSLAGTCWVKVMNILIQPMQLFDQLFGWQKMLQRLHDSTNIKKQGLAKMLGDCEICFSHFMTMIWFFVYAFMMNVFIRVWITSFINYHGITWWLCAILGNAIWYVLFGSIGTITGIFALTHKFGIKIFISGLFKKKDNELLR